MGYEEDKKGIDEGLEKIKTISESVEKIVKQVGGQEDLTQTYKQEMGDIRKDLKELKDAGGEGNDDKIKELVDKIEELGNNIKNSSNNTHKGGAGDDKDWDEKELSKAAKAKADELYKTLSPEQKTYIATDLKKREEFLKAAQEATSTVPDSLFEEPAGGEHTDNEFRKLFGIAGSEADFIPGSPNGGGSRYAGADTGLDNEVHITKRLPGGSIPRGNKTQ